jgi:hypothetical protein
MISGKMKLLSAVVGAAALVATPALASKTNKKRYQVSPQRECFPNPTWI